MTKLVDLLNVSVTQASGVLTPGAAVAGGRTLPQAITDGDVAVGDTGLSIVVTDGTSRELGMYTVTGTAQAPTLTRTSVVRNSAGGTNPVTFSGSLTAYSDAFGSFLNGLLSASQGVAPSSLSAAGALADSNLVLLSQDGSNIVSVTLGTLKSYLGTVTGTATVTGVSVTPSTASLSGAGTQQFSATVTGTNSPAQTVTWTATGGTITTGGLYTAPAATGSAQTITVTATSTVDNTKSGTATVTVAASTSTVTGVTVSPTSPTVNGGVGTQQFTATVAGTNSPSQGVTWTSTAGSITTGGLFTAPLATGSAQTVTVTATSTQNNSFSGSTTVTVPAQAIVVTTPSSSPTVGTPFTLSGTYTGPAPTALDYQTTDNAGTPSAWVAASSPTISGGTWSFSVTPTNSSTSRTVTVRDHVNTGITGTSGAYVVNAAPASLTIGTIPTPQTVGTAFAVSGTWTGTQPTGLTYATADNGGALGSFAAMNSVVINANGTWTASVTPSSASTSRTMVVKDTGLGTVSPASNAYVVNAAAAPVYKLTTTAAPNGGISAAYATTGTITGGSATTDGNAYQSAKIYILDQNGNAPTGTVLFAWGGSATNPPTLTGTSTVHSTNPDNAGCLTNATPDEPNTVQTAAILGSWSPTGATNQTYYGLFTGGSSLYAFGKKPGTAVNAYLWVQIAGTWVAKPYDNNTGTPIPWVLT